MSDKLQDNGMREGGNDRIREGRKEEGRRG